MQTCSGYEHTFKIGECTFRSEANTNGAEEEARAAVQDETGTSHPVSEDDDYVFGCRKNIQFCDNFLGLQFLNRSYIFYSRYFFSLPCVVYNIACILLFYCEYFNFRVEILFYRRIFFFRGERVYFSRDYQLFSRAEKYMPKI